MVMKRKEKISLDITNDKCPITFVKTKIALEKLKSNQYLKVYIREGDALNGLPSSLKELGYQIDNKIKLNDDIFSLEISKKN